MATENQVFESSNFAFEHHGEATPTSMDRD